MANEETQDVKSQINRAAEVEKGGIVLGATDALTEDASRARGVRLGRSLAAGACEAQIAHDLGYANKGDLRRLRRDDPATLLSAIMGGRR